ncbi:MAG: class IV adenylate cyclase [Pyrinomonadaceae bacterium]
MPIEIEKKFKLTKQQRKSVQLRLLELGANFQGQQFEENTLYRGKGLEIENSVLRLRRVDDGAILTYKKRLPSASSIKSHLEEETPVADPGAMNAILGALGFTSVLVYEKRREVWRLGEVEIVIDELPFGLFMEIEGNQSEIRKTERGLGLKDLRTEPNTYPQLTLKKGVKNRGVIEARFEAASKRKGRRP